MKKIYALILVFVSALFAFSEINVSGFVCPFGPYQLQPGEATFAYFTCWGADLEYEHNFPWFEVTAGIGVKETNPYYQKLNFRAGAGKKFTFDGDLEVDLKCLGNIGIISIPDLTWGITVEALVQNKGESGLYAGIGADLMFTPKYKWHGTTVHPNFPIFAGYKFVLPFEKPKS